MTDDGLDGIRARFADGYPPRIDIEMGWYHILLELDRELTEIDPSLRYIQVKQKFGGIRVYTTRPSEESWNIVRRAKRRAQGTALRTCESCGTAGVLHQREGWFRTLCCPCAGEGGYTPVPDERMRRAVLRLARIDALRVADVEPTPEELILRAYVEGSDRGELVAALSAYPFTFPEYVDDGRRTGTWDQVTVAFYQRYLTADELGAVRVSGHTPRHSQWAVPGTIYVPRG